MDVYDVPQLTVMLQVSEKTVRQYLKAGKLAGRKVGKRWLVAQCALERFLQNDDRIPTASSQEDDGTVTCPHHVAE